MQPIRVFRCFNNNDLYQTDLVPGPISMGLKQVRHDANHSPPNAEVKNVGTMPPLPHIY